MQFKVLQTIYAVLEQKLKKYIQRKKKDRQKGKKIYIREMFYSRD